nr:hypothetical protein [Tanacetum cinerariifolium]
MRGWAVSSNRGDQWGYVPESNLRPACRLNSSDDQLWERIHSRLAGASSTSLLPE